MEDHALAPFADWRVLELSNGIAVSYCAKMFADAGADVHEVARHVLVVRRVRLFVERREPEHGAARIAECLQARDEDAAARAFEEVRDQQREDEHDHDEPAGPAPRIQHVELAEQRQVGRVHAHRAQRVLPVLPHFLQRPVSRRRAAVALQQLACVSEIAPGA